MESLNNLLNKAKQIPENELYVPDQEVGESEIPLNQAVPQPLRQLWTLAQNLKRDAMMATFEMNLAGRDRKKLQDLSTSNIAKSSLLVQLFWNELRDTIAAKDARVWSGDFTIGFRTGWEVTLEPSELHGNPLAGLLGLGR